MSVPTEIVDRQPRWILWWLRAAALYNVAWGAWAVLWPQAFWSLVGMQPPNYPFLWQCIGMIVGVYGVGYWIAGGNAARHWPIVLVGLLGKVFGPIGFVWACWVERQVPPHFGLTILTNDLVWWVPFAMILRYAYLADARNRRWVETQPQQIADLDAISTVRDHHGRTLAELSRGRDVLVVFLRHAGCTFCREALADLAKQQERLRGAGVAIALVSQSSDASMEKQCAQYGVRDAARFSDPQRVLYRAFELRRGTLSELFGPRLWIRGFSAGILAGHGIGALDGDGFQMPGAFLIRDGAIQRAFRHRDAADRPDYCELSLGAGETTA